MRKLLAALLLAVPDTLFAQNFVTFSPLNSLTKEPLDSVYARLTTVRNDSVIPWAADTLRLNRRQSCSFVYPKGAGTYTLTLSAPGYAESAPRTFTVKKTTAYFHTALGNILLDRDYSRALNEVTVTATKIKMVMKGDTIVYNADAFQLAEGSVLDELIRQLPGAQLDEGGVIKVNGKQVSSLLVNGRDFFKGDPMVALRNLPAYTVNTVKVYEKEPDYASLVKTGDKKPEYPLVMDVNLKKQFNVGWLGNVEGGYGTGNRYIGRAFAMGYTNSTQIGLFANFNNISNTSSAANTGEWNRGWGANGELTLKFFGANVNWEKKQEKYTHKIDASAKVTREDRKFENGSASTSYYESGDRYGRSQQTSKEGKTHVWLDGSYSLRAPKYYLHVSPFWEYMHTRRDGLSRSAQFTAPPRESYRSASLDSLFMAPGSPELERITLLRSREVSASTSSQHYMYLNWNWRYRRFNFFGTESYRRENADGHNIYTLDYTDPALQADNQYQRVYTPTRNTSYNLTFHGGYNFWAGSESKFVHWQFIPSYDYRRTYTSANNPRYRLDRLEGWGADSNRPLTSVPSNRTEMELAIDRQNSLRTARTVESHSPGLQAIYGIFWHDDRDKFYVIPQFTDHIEAERLHYVKPAGDTDLRLARTTHSLQPNLFISFASEREGHECYFQTTYDYRPGNPELLDMIETVDDSNPLYVRLGNPSLQRSHRHEARIYGRYRDKKHKVHFDFSTWYTLNRGMVSTAIFYNPQTGVTTARPMNINGNREITGNIGVYKYAEKTQMWCTIGVNYNHAADYISETAVPQRSIVHNWNTYARAAFTLDFRGSNNLKVEFNPVWLRQYSSRANFTATSAWNFNYGLTLTLNELIPWDIKFSTSLQFRSRTGYNSAEMNKTEYVWNAQLSKVIASHWTVSVEGFDILGSVKNISRTLNSQGYYENWYSALPSYVMLKVAYRFQIYPKNAKKPEETTR